MASYLQVENISKSYGPKVLFEKISFNINEGDKMALIGPNGCGKSSLLRILAGHDRSDSGGKITFLKNISIAFLEQEYRFDNNRSIMEEVIAHAGDKISAMEDEHRWEFEHRLEKYLTAFGLNNLRQNMSELSGGEIKRVAIAALLAEEPDFLVLDEPTNHLDIEAIETLENILSKSKATLLMVTHDRYFLDKVCNTILEIDNGALYVYKGNYGEYLVKREERLANTRAETDKYRNIFRRELEWMRSTPQARTGKARYRINAFYDIKEKAFSTNIDRQINMEGLNGSRLGTKIFNCRNVSFAYGNKKILDGFTYNFQRYEKVGIVGGNGVGKSTFLNILTGRTAPQSGEIERGETLKIGYYHQSGIKDAGFRGDDTVIETINDTSLLNRFLFPHNMLNSRLDKLSGGEMRRLYLLTILAKSPNLLILDEPTNDLDIVTLNILEEYLKEFNGSLIIVSHDRHFLDRLVDHLFIFCGNGTVKDFIGNYSEYTGYMKEYRAANKSTQAKTDTSRKTWNGESQKRKLSYREQKELEGLEREIDELTAEKAEIEQRLSKGDMKYEEITSASQRISEIISLLEVKEDRWLELSCI